MDMNEFYLMMVLMAVGCFGLLGYLTTVKVTGPSRTDCMVECQVDGWQYRPLVYGGECWCDALEGRPLTAEEE